MLLNLLTGIPVMFLCLVLQAVFVITNLRYYAHFKNTHEDHDSQWRDILLLSIVMLLMLLSNLAQMLIWAVLFVLLGEFSDFSTAMYHSAVNFVTITATAPLETRQQSKRWSGSAIIRDVCTSSIVIGSW